jgi:hypothetical protein
MIIHLFSVRLNGEDRFDHGFGPFAPSRRTAHRSFRLRSTHLQKSENSNKQNKEPDGNQNLAIKML